MYKPKSKKQDTLLIYGVHAIEEALTAGKTLEKVWIRKEGNPHARISHIREAAQRQGAAVQYVPEIKLKKLVGEAARHQGAVAQLSPIAYQPLEELIIRSQGKEGDPFFLMLDGVTDVRNLGAIARTCECLGVDGLIIPGSGGAMINGDTVRVSAGALHHLPVSRVPHLLDALMLFEAYGIPVWGCTEKGQDLLFTTDLTGPMCLVMGSEEKGIQPTLVKRLNGTVNIPLYGKVGSLNVSVAAGIALAEVVRQRLLGLGN